MRNLLIVVLILLLATTITSCQKEIILNNPSTTTTGGGGGGIIPPGTTGDLLVKIYGKIGTGADSNVTYFTYNTAKQLITRRMISNTNGGMDNYDAFERNSAGLIVKRKQFVISGMLPVPTDTAVTNYYYSTGATPQLKYSVTSMSLLGFSSNDSTVYTFNASGKLSMMEHYQSDLLTSSYGLSSRYIFAFDGTGNTIKLDLYLTNTGTPTLVSTQLFSSYDSKAPSQTFTEIESCIINSEPAFIHNPTKSQINNFVAGAGNIINDFTLTYNSTNKPATAKLVTQFNGTTTITNSTFYYQ